MEPLAWNEIPVVARFKVPGADHAVEPALPRGPKGPGGVTVICGVNAAGKTYVLRGIAKSVTSKRRGETDTSSMAVGLTRDATRDLPKFALFTSTATNKERSGGIDLALGRDKLYLPADMVNYRIPMLEFFRRELLRRFEEEGASDFDSWIDDVDRRRRLAQRLPKEVTIFAADASDPFVVHMERVLDSQLYYRRCEKSKLELVKRGRDGVTQVYSRWSEGQKAAFHLVGMVLLERPDIVLLDEIENHMHPQLMSTVLEFLRGAVPQTLIATHHPHVIFSKWVDRVFYLEAMRKNLYDDRPDELPFDKSTDPAPPRLVRSMDDDFDRLASAYALFDKQDQKLMQQAALVSDGAVAWSIGAIQDLFVSAAPVAASTRPSPDGQTLQVLEWIRSHQSGELARRVLDLGAGVGRTVLESLKLGSWTPITEVEWLCWEAFPHTRGALKAAVGEIGCIRVIDSLDEVRDGECSIALIANVLHELTPPVAARMIDVAHQKVLRSGGSLLVLEIFPLLTPEKFAVPYPAEALERVLRKVGIASYHVDISVRGSHAYLLCCRVVRPTEEFQKNLLAALDEEWKDLQRAATGRYAGIGQATSPETYRRFLSEMTTIASITAWREGLWFQE